jgi:hypothetical protein
MFFKTWLFQMHDVLAAPWRGADEDDPTEDRCAILSHLLRDHAAQRVAKDIACFEAKCVEERQSVRGHAGDGLGDLAARTADAGALEQDDFPSLCKRIGDGGIPVVERSCKVLQAQQRKPRTGAKSPVGVSLVFHGDELCGGCDVACVRCRQIRISLVALPRNVTFDPRLSGASFSGAQGRRASRSPHPPAKRIQGFSTRVDVLPKQTV